MTNTEFKACLENYRKALLEIIPAYYSRSSLNLAKADPPEDLEDVMIHLMDKSLLPKEGCKKRDPKIDDFLASVKKKCSCEHADFTKKMKKVLQYIDPFAQEMGWPPFRFKFFDNERDAYREADLISKDVERNVMSINSCFGAYLRYLKETKRNNEAKASGLVREKMFDQKYDYIRKYVDSIDNELEKQPKSKKLEATYLYRGGHPDHSFYAVVSRKKNPIKINLTEDTQGYMALDTFYNAKKQRASIEKLLYECGIKKYKKGSHAIEDKKPALQKVISSLNTKLKRIFNIKCVELDETTKEHYRLVVVCRDKWILK